MYLRGNVRDAYGGSRHLLRTALKAPSARIFQVAFGLRRRIVLSLAACQALFQTASVLIMTVGGLAGLTLAPEKSLATLPISTVALGTAITTIPASLMMGLIDRELGFLLGALIGATLLTATALSKPDSDQAALILRWLPQTVEPLCAWNLLQFEGARNILPGTLQAKRTKYKFKRSWAATRPLGECKRAALLHFGALRWLLFRIPSHMPPPRSGSLTCEAKG